MAMVKLPTLSHRMAYICGLLEDLNMFTIFRFFRARQNGKQEERLYVLKCILNKRNQKIHFFIHTR